MPQSLALNVALQRTLVPQLCETGRQVLRVVAAGGVPDVTYAPSTNYSVFRRAFISVYAASISFMRARPSTSRSGPSFT